MVLLIATVRWASDGFIRGLDWEVGSFKYARLVMYFSEDWVIGELREASLVIGLTDSYSMLG